MSRVCDPEQFALVWDFIITGNTNNFVPTYLFLST